MSAQWLPHKPETWPFVYGELKADTTFSWYEGYWENNEPVMREEIVPAGTTVKIVMVSRFGDIGVTTDLTAYRGNYGARISFDQLENLRKDF